MNERLKKLYEDAQRLEARSKELRAIAPDAMTDEQRDELTSNTEQRQKVKAQIDTENAAAMLDLESRQNQADLGMPKKELEQYSMLRMIRSVMPGGGREKEAPLEWEASKALEKRLNKSPRGSFFVPNDYLQRQGASRISQALMEMRDMTKAAPTGGGNLIGTDLLSGSFIDMLRNKMMTRAAGAKILTGLVGDIAIPRKTSGTTAYWLGENTAIDAESQPVIGQVALTPKTVGAYTDISRKLIQQSSMDVEMMVQDDLALALALAMDVAGLHGTGDNNQPRGIAATSGIGSVVGGEHGAAPDWADIVNLETEVAVDNADIGSLAYMTNAKVRGKLKQTAKVASTDSKMIWDDGQFPLNGYPAYITNQVSATLTKGNQSLSSAIFFGNWADLVIAMWGVLDILVDPYTGGTAGTVRIIEFQDTDIAVRHAASFAAMLDALTA